MLFLKSMLTFFVQVCPWRRGHGGKNVHGSHQAGPDRSRTLPDAGHALRGSLVGCFESVPLDILTSCQLMLSAHCFFFLVFLEQSMRFI